MVETLVIACYLLAMGPVAWGVSDPPLGEAAGESLSVTCSPDRPVVSDGIVVLRAWVSTTDGQSLGQGLEYDWQVSTGQTSGEGHQVHWRLAGTEPGIYVARVRIKAPGGQERPCEVQVIVESRLPANGEDPVRGGASRETGWSFLLPNQVESKGYGLYSYLLFGSPPNRAMRERYLRVIEAYLTLIPHISRLERYFPPSELNITYLPIEDEPPQGEGLRTLAEWILDHYDYARARFLLSKVAGPDRRGPYIISGLKPPDRSAVRASFLYQDMSHVPPSLAWSWTKEFLNQAAQERFWEERTLPKLRLRIRTTIAILATGLPEVQKALDSWIAWLRG